MFKKLIKISLVVGYGGEGENQEVRLEKWAGVWEGFWIYSKCGEKSQEDNM